MPKTRRNRWIAGCAFAMVLLCVSLGVASWVFGQRFLEDALAGREVMSELMQSDTSSVVVMSFDDNGVLIDDEHALMHAPDTPRILASTMKIVVLGAYATEVASGNFDPEESISVAEWERYYLPGTDGGAHPASLADLDINTDSDGFARDPNERVQLQDLARVMIHTSDNAATDYLIDRLGQEKLAAAMAAAGMTQHTPIRPILGTFLSWQNHKRPEPDAAYLADFLAKDETERYAIMQQYQASYMEDADWRADEIAWLSTLTAEEYAEQDDLVAYHVQAAQSMAQGTAREYAQLMALIATGQYVSAETSQIMQQILESFPGAIGFTMLYDEYGLKNGSVPGVLTEAAYVTPRRGDLAGQGRVAVVFLNDIPSDVWLSPQTLTSFATLNLDLASGMSGLDE